MATTRASAVCSSVHMVRMYTWPRTETNQRTNQATNQPACSVNKDNDIATTTTRPNPNHARHATPTPATPMPRASRSAENASFVCVPKTPFPFPFPSLHFTSSVVRSIAEGTDKNVRPLLCGVRLVARCLLRTPRNTSLYGYLDVGLGLLRV